MPHIFFKEMQERIVFRACERIGVINIFYVLDDQLVSLLLGISKIHSRQAHKVVRVRQQLYVEIDVWRNYAILIKNVDLITTKELDHRTFRQSRESCV